MKIDRLLGILTLLLQRDRITAPELAERFEVNRRTISRDIDALCQAGIPIVTYQGIGGGISIADGFRLDKNVLTTGELSTMIAALKGIGTVEDKSNIERTLDKLQVKSDAVVSLHEPVIIDLASHYKEHLTDKIKQIKQAILESRTIMFDYFYKKGESHRIIEPIFVIFQWSSWYVFGYCLMRQDWRMFKLTRLWNLEISDEKFTPRPVPPDKKDFNAGFPDHKRLTALFDPSVKYQLIDAYGYECYTETEEGLLLEMGFTNDDAELSWLLGFGDKVKVLEPEAIIEAIKTTAKNIINRYNQT